MKNRKDLWTEEENRMLMNIVLEHIQIGSTKTAAFKKASNVLGRTTAACRYRWNNVLSKEENTPIPIPSQPLQLPPPEETLQQTDPVNLSIDQVIDFLQKLNTNGLESELHVENKRLLSEQEELNAQFNALEKAYLEKKERFQTLRTQYESFAKVLNESEDMIKGHIVH